MTWQEAISRLRRFLDTVLLNCFLRATRLCLSVKGSRFQPQKMVAILLTALDGENNPLLPSNTQNVGRKLYPNKLQPMIWTCKFLSVEWSILGGAGKKNFGLSLDEEVVSHDFVRNRFLKLKSVERRSPLLGCEIGGQVLDENARLHIIHPSCE